MQLFLDTTDVNILKDLAATGLVDGVTTNPTLIAKSGRPMLQVIREICDAIEGPVSAEVAAQALLAAKAGATYISPFIGRLDDHGADGMDLITEIRTIYDNFDYDTEILAASIRTPTHVKEAAMAGADCATIPPSVFQDLFKHPLTEKGLEQFMSDWTKTGQSIL